MVQTFTAQLDSIFKGWEKAMLAVARQSIQEVVQIAQTPKAKGGRMPVVTSFLRNSLASGVNGSFGSASVDSYVFVIATMKLGDTSHFAWTAEYAMRIENGFTGTDSAGRYFNQQGAHFVASAAAQWPQIVAKNAARVRR